MGSGGFDLESIAREEHGANFKQLHHDPNDAYSWQIELKNGARLGFDLDRWAKAKYGQDCRVTCDRRNAYSWNWVVGVVTAPLSQTNDETNNELAWVCADYKLLMAKATKAGAMTFDQEVEEGFTHSSEVNAKVSAKIEAAMQGLVASGNTSIESELGASFCVSYTASTKVKKTMTIAEGSEGYIYQSRTKATDKGGNAMEWLGTLVMTERPLCGKVEKRF